MKIILLLLLAYELHEGVQTNARAALSITNRLHAHEISDGSPLPASLVAQFIKLSLRRVYDGLETMNI